MRLRVVAAASVLLVAVGGATWRAVQLPGPNPTLDARIGAPSSARDTQPSKAASSTRPSANASPSTAPAAPTETATTDPVKRMAQRLARKGDQQLASLQRLCSIDEAGVLRARAILADFNRDLVDLADQGRAGSLQPAEFASLERQALDRKAAAWCHLLREGDWGPERCRQAAAQCNRSPWVQRGALR